MSNTTRTAYISWVTPYLVEVLVGTSCAGESAPFDTVRSTAADCWTAPPKRPSDTETNSQPVRTHRRTLTICTACSYSNLSAVILVTLSITSGLFSCLHSTKVVRNLLFRLDMTANKRQSTPDSSGQRHSPFFTFELGRNWPDFICEVAKAKPEPSSCKARTRRTNRSALFTSSFCIWDWSWTESWRAPIGVERVAAKSKMQLLRAKTKLILAKVSLCSFCETKNSRVWGEI